MRLALPRIIIRLALAVGLAGLSTAACEDLVYDPCGEVICDGPGTCTWTADGTLYCDCADGYLLDPGNPRRCIKDESINDCNHEEAALRAK